MIFGFHLYVQDMELGTNMLVDADTNGVGSITNLMTFPCISDSGNVVAFDSLDGNLVANDNNRAYDIFTRNLTANSTELISAGLTGITIADAERVECHFQFLCQYERPLHRFLERSGQSGVGRYEWPA